MFLPKVYCIASENCSWDSFINSYSEWGRWWFHLTALLIKSSAVTDITSEEIFSYPPPVNITMTLPCEQ